MSEQITNQLNIGLMRLVGEESLAVITRLNPTDSDPEYIGNVLRRTCTALGESACVHGCGLRATGMDRSAYEKQCADGNLTEAFNTLRIAPGNVLMVAVTGNDVGFGDKLDDYRSEGKVAQNPNGWSELPGYNAFFARPDEVPAIGSRLADCAHLEFEFKDKDGKTVIGFEHGTRPNMYGKDAYAFEIDDKPVSYTEYVLTIAVEHYEADPADLQIRISSSIRPDNFAKHFDNREKMEKHIPGWMEAGFVKNDTNPEWTEGDAILADDIWHADARGFILHDIHAAMASLGIPAENLKADGMLDPADTEGEFAHMRNVIHMAINEIYT